MRIIPYVRDRRRGAGRQSGGQRWLHCIAHVVPTDQRSSMPVIITVHGELPPWRYTQNEITEALLEIPDYVEHEQLIRAVHASADVQNRHLVFPLEHYADLTKLGDLPDLYVENAVDLGCRAINSALDKARLLPTDVDIIFTTTVTGHAVPTLNAQLTEHLGLRTDVRRVPLFGPGFGCAAGVAGIARLHDYLRGHPDSVGVLLTVELCSLTIEANPSKATLLGSAHFGDGAAAVVAAGHHRADSMLMYGPETIDSRSQIYADGLQATEKSGDAGRRRESLAPIISVRLEHQFVDDVRDFLSSQGVAVTDVGAWICHPGGPINIDAIAADLGLPNEALELTRRSLANVGNLSSSSVLHVLSDTIEQEPPAGAPGVLMAVGSGFCSETVLVRWS